MPLQVPLSEKNTEISFTSFAGAENFQNTQQQQPQQSPPTQVAFLTTTEVPILSSSSSAVNCNPINNDGVDPPPPYVAWSMGDFVTELGYFLDNVGCSSSSSWNKLPTATIR